MFPINDNVDEVLLHMMEAGEVIDEMVDKIEQLLKLDFEHVSRAAWADAQLVLGATSEILEDLRKTIPTTSKIIDNPALKAHINAVVNAPD